MKLLLDTHCWLWLQTEPERLGESVTDQLADPDNELLLSAASSWEIAIKFALGKLPLPEPPATYVPSRLAASGVEPLPIHHAHALRVAELPPHHADPFDRLLVAQAQQRRWSPSTISSRRTTSRPYEPAERAARPPAGCSRPVRRCRSPLRQCRCNPLRAREAARG